MLDPKRLLDELLGSKVPGTGSTAGGAVGKVGDFARQNPLATGALAAILLGTGTGRKLGGSALKLGGMAAVAGLAYKAYQNYQQSQQPGGGQAPAPAREPVLIEPPRDTGFNPADAPQGEGSFALAVVRAMVAAARADGHIDESERTRIGDRLKMAGLGGDAERFLMDELARPVDLDSIVAAAQTEAQRVELYTASRIAIEPQTRAERGYLDMLAGRLGLPDPLVDHVEATVAEAKV
jgi:uncharacterized membrane protein YebE (DUF533 family)